MPGGPKVTRGPPGPAILYTGVVPVFNGPDGTGPAMPPLPETIPAGGLATPDVSGNVLDSLALDCLSHKFRDPRFTLESSHKRHRNLSQISAASLSVCHSSLGSVGLRYHVKTQRAAGSVFHSSDLSQTT